MSCWHYCYYYAIGTFSIKYHSYLDDTEWDIIKFDITGIKLFKLLSQILDIILTNNEEDNKQEVLTWINIELN